MVHAVASLFDHDRLLSIVFSPSLAGSLAEERGTRSTEYTSCERFTGIAAVDVLAERFAMVSLKVGDTIRHHGGGILPGESS